FLSQDSLAWLGGASRDPSVDFSCAPPGSGRPFGIRAGRSRPSRTRTRGRPRSLSALRRDGTIGPIRRDPARPALRPPAGGPAPVDSRAPGAPPRRSPLSAAPPVSRGRDAARARTGRPSPACPNSAAPVAATDRAPSLWSGRLRQGG